MRNLLSALVTLAVLAAAFAPAVYAGVALARCAARRR